MAQIQVVKGPSKFDLMMSLFGGGMVTRIDVSFELEPGIVFGNKLRVVIGSLVREDGTGDRWVFEGYVVAEPHVPSIRNVKGYFDCTTRRGWLQEVLINPITVS